MTIEDIRKENQSVFDKIDAEFAPNVRAGQYAKAYASILRDLEKKERSAQSYVRPDKKTVVGVIIAIVLLLVVGVYYTYGAVHIDDARYAQTYTICCSVAYSAAAIVAIVSVSVFAARYNRWKKISNKVVFLQEYWNVTKTCMRNIVGKSKTKNFGRNCANLPQPLRAKVHRQANRAVLQLLRLRHPTSKAVKDISLPHQTESTTRTVFVTGATPKTADCTIQATIKSDT